MSVDGGVDRDQLCLWAAVPPVEPLGTGNLNIGGFGSFPLGAAVDVALLSKDGGNWNALSLQNN